MSSQILLQWLRVEVVKRGTFFCQKGGSMTEAKTGSVISSSDFWESFLGIRYVGWNNDRKTSKKIPLIVLVSSFHLRNYFLGFCFLLI